MLSHLSTHTRQFVKRLVQGESITIGGTSIPALADPQRRFLLLLATHLRSLSDKKGADLGEEIERLLPDLPALAVTEEPTDSQVQPSVRRKLARIRTQSFRGIAPAGQIWEFDFEARSHLLYGPNGSGKSSLFGAICWALTGRLFRDDGPPSAPSSVTYYSRGRKPKAEGMRHDALTLLSSDGSMSSPTDTYTVDLELTSAVGSADSVWLRRRSSDGLWTSINGEDWQPIDQVSAIGLSDLDVELQVLMPARIGHMRFGKDSEVLSIFSQIVGLDDLELIADLAGKCHTAFTKDANALERKGIKDSEAAAATLVQTIKQSAPDYVKAMNGYDAFLDNNRTATEIASLQDTLDTEIHSLTTQLAQDLEVVLPEPNTPEAATIQMELEPLPGHIDSATLALGQPLAQLFGSSVGLAMRLPYERDAERRALLTYVAKAQERINDRLDWAQREQQSQNAALMLAAAEHFPEHSTYCPVCSQDLTPVPRITEALNALRPLTGQAHLKQSLDDLERSLLSELDQIVPQRRRETAHHSLGARLRTDWSALCTSRFLGLVTKVAERFDESIEALAAQLPLTLTSTPPLVSEHHRPVFPEAFSSLQAAVASTMRVLALDDDRAAADASLITCLSATLLQGDQSLAGLLHRGRDTNRKIRELSTIRTQLATLHHTQANIESLKTRVQRLKALAGSSMAIKDLGENVRQETIIVVQEVEPVMKQYYGRLYDTEHLTLDLVTPGHAANPGIKDEFNVYFRAGDSRLPAGPFANAGRLRALALCFAFSLLSRAHGTLGLHLLDDPALSLDDEHKARFIDHVVGPYLAREQVLLATHYENFFKCAELRFGSDRCLQLVPRRTPKDAVAFEPADLLQRVGFSLEAKSTSWREMGINIRRWGERTLATLSGYCPIPFVIFNNIPDSVRAYANIKDERIATGRRDAIVAALMSPKFLAVVHKAAHDEAITESDIRDAYSRLMDCRKPAEAEICRLQEIHKHELLKRGIAPRPVLGTLQLNTSFPAVEIPIVGHAAAASNGVGISWVEPENMHIPECPMVIVRTDVLAPIASVGDFALLDVDETIPADGELVAIRSEEKETYLRRFWRHDQLVSLEATNPTCPYPPAIFPANHCEARRVVGVLFKGVPARAAAAGEEWATVGTVKYLQLDDVKGIRVDGTSLEPIARDGQVVLVRKASDVRDVGRGELACVELEDIGAVLKRCYTKGHQFVLCPVNPVDVEEPIVVDRGEVLRIYRIVGVLFEPLSTIAE